MKLKKNECSKGGQHNWETFVSSRHAIGAKKCAKCGKITDAVKRVRTQGMRSW